jgi:hypothetical protein
MTRLLFLLALGCLGCSVRASSPAELRVPTPAEVPALTLPSLVVALEGTVLRLAENEKVKVAFPRAGLPLRVREARREAVRVELDGGIRVEGLTTLEELGVEVCEPGPLSERFYAGNGNRLRLRSGIDAGRIRVSGEVAVREVEYSKDVHFLKQFRRIPFETGVEVSRLCPAPQPPRHAGTAEDPEIARVFGEPDEEDFPKGTHLIDIEKGAPLTLLDAPGGNPVHTFPATQWGFTLIRVRTEGRWDLVAAGGGPYLLGWIPTRSPRDMQNAFGIGGLGMSSSQKGPWALHTARLKQLPLHRVPAGTPLQHFGVVRATLNADGYARVQRTNGRWSYVVAAVDDEVTVQGWMETSALGEPLD